MEIGLACLLVAAGVAASWWSAHVIVRANADQLIPYVGNPDHLPGWAMLLRGVGAGLAFLGAVTIGPVIGIWILLVVTVFVLVPQLLPIWLHNRRLEREVGGLREA